MLIRKIEARDNPCIANIIRQAFIEFNMPKEGTVYSDASTNHLFDMFQKNNTVYYVVEKDNKVVGGCGIYPTEGLPEGYAELVKFYISPDYRGMGIGGVLMERCITSARQSGYTHLYLESFPELGNAVSIYKKQGFEILDTPLGNSGHFACTIWMLKNLFVS